MSDESVAGSGPTRADFLADIAAEGSLLEQWLGRTYDVSDTASGDEPYGYHPAFAHLVAGLTGSLRDKGAAAFAGELLQALPAEADTAELVRRWFIGSWADGPWCLADRLVDTPAFEPASAVIALLRTSLDQEVSPRDWRTVRSALARVDGLDLDTADYVQVVMAMAWDLDQVPGTAGDVINAWSAAIMHAGNRAQGWTAELGAELETLYLAMHEQAVAAADKTDQETTLRTFHEELEKLRAASPRTIQLMDQREKCFTHANENRQQWLNSARSRLVSLATHKPIPS